MAARDPRDWMWTEALELLDRADRLNRQFFRTARAPGCRPTWEPPADVLEAADAFIVVVALPGVAPEHVEVLLEGRNVVVVGERPMPCEPRGAHILRLEIPYGRFERRIELPPGPLELARKEVVHGCLVVAFRKL